MTPAPTRLLAILAIAIGTGLTAGAQHHGAHVHGEAQAAIAVEEAEVSVTLTSAMYNITGFERAPQDEAEASALSDAIAALETTGTVVAFNPEAGCTAASVSHSLPKSAGEASKADGDHNPYRDLEADYVFNCADIDQLSSVTFPLFERFGNLETLDVVVLKGRAQIAGELDGAQDTLSLD